MTTAVAEKKGDVIFANKAHPGMEYLWVNKEGKTTGRTLVDKILPDGKVVVHFFVDGYGFKTTPHTVPGSQALKVVETKAINKPQGGDMPKNTKPSKKAAKVVKAPRVKKEPAQKLERLQKIKEGDVPVTELDGAKYRSNYRARSNAQRVADCEAAKKDSCHCRCQGALHGKSHGKFVEAEAEMFELAAKDGRSFITAQEAHRIVKRFGGPVKHEPKPRGRKPGSKNKAAKKK